MYRKQIMALLTAVILISQGSAFVFAEETTEVSQDSQETELSAETETEADPAEELYNQYKQAKEEGNYEEAMNYLAQGVELNDTRCIMVTGQEYYEGGCVEQDYEKAMEYLLKATEMGDGKAPRYVGLMYEKGLGVDQSYEKAAEYYTIAADESVSNGGDITSQYRLGRLYEFGLGVEQDYEKARELYEKAAERGDEPAAAGMVGLASLYEHGKGVQQNLTTAKEWYDKAEAAGYSIEKGEPKSVTAVTEVFGNGERITEVVLEYNEELDAKSITEDTYLVADRTITGVYVNSEDSIPEESTDGNYVIITLDPEDDDLYASVYKGGIENGGNGPTGTSGSGILKYVMVDVYQQMGIQTTDETILVSSGLYYENHDVKEEGIDDFQQMVFEDEVTGETLAYNLFVPEGYSETEEYPLVLYMSDASANGEDVFLTLRQGNGATVWATEEEQEKHPSFVLAPQFVGSESAETVMDLINYIKEEYSIDEKRVYTTGQSQGCIMSITLAQEYRGVFAGLLLVAGQGDAEEMRILEEDNIWIIVSEGDKKGYPGMNESVAAWEEDGIAVAKGVWDAGWSEEEFDNAAAEMRSEGTSIKYTCFALGTTWDGDPAEEDPNEHNSSMHYAYNIESVRDWLFDQVLGEKNA